MDIPHGNPPKMDSVGNAAPLNANAPEFQPQAPLVNLHSDPVILHNENHPSDYKPATSDKGVNCKQSTSDKGVSADVKPSTSDKEVTADCKPPTANKGVSLTTDNGLFDCVSDVIKTDLKSTKSKLQQTSKEVRVLKGELDKCLASNEDFIKRKNFDHEVMSKLKC